jgi:hypothetical protein
MRPTEVSHASWYRFRVVLTTDHVDVSEDRLELEEEEE